MLNNFFTQNICLNKDVNKVSWERAMDGLKDQMVPWQKNNDLFVLSEHKLWMMIQMMIIITITLIITFFRFRKRE